MLEYTVAVALRTAGGAACPSANTSSRLKFWQNLRGEHARRRPPWPSRQPRLSTAGALKPDLIKYYQALDIAQSRAIKRRDNALRQIARWRDGLGAKARALSDKFIAEQALEQALAERYDAVHLLADAETDNNADEAMEAAPQLAPVGDAADIAPAVPTSEETAADIAPAVPPSEETAADFAPAVPPADEGAEAAPPRAPADDEPINWVGWLTGAERYTWLALSKGAHKDFKQPSTSKKWLVQNLVVDRKVIRPDQLCPELAQHPSCAHSRRLRGGPEMSSQKQIEANLRNAQKSKGPRTAAGKARASRNSRKHALSTISHNNPFFAQRIEAIAREICPETTNSALREQALIIGECTTVLVCVQDERIALIEQSLGSTSAHMTDADAAGRAELGASQCKPAPARDELKAMGLAARDLNRLERYARRALSRRKRAIETSMGSTTCRNPEGSDFASCPAPLQHLELIKNEVQPNFNFWQNEPKSCGTRAIPMFGT